MSQSPILLLCQLVGKEARKMKEDKRTRKKANESVKLIVFFRVCLCTSHYAV